MEKRNLEFKELFNSVYELIKDQKYAIAVDLSLNERKTIFKNKEIENFFQKYRKEKNHRVYSVSGSGGSRIRKPNLTTILAYHLAEYYKYADENVIIYKTGSKKRTSFQGSTDFIEKYNINNFLYNDDEIFNLTLQCLRFNNTINNYLQSHYLCSKKVDKKIIFTCNLESVEKYKKSPSCDNILLIYSIINGKMFDEINPINYGLKYINNKIINKSKYNPYKYFSINDIDTVNYLNEKLLKGIIDDFWGICLKYEMIESISFFQNISFCKAEKEVNDYFKSL